MPSSVDAALRPSRRVRLLAVRGLTILALSTAPTVLAAPVEAVAQAPSSGAPSSGAPSAGAAASDAGATSSDEPSTTLYERLGGFDFIAGFVDVAFPRVASHPELTRLFGGHAVDTQLRQRQLVVELLCARTGGPCVYIGRPLATAHDGLGITAEDWETFMAIIDDATDELGVPPEIRDEWIAMWEGFRGASVLEDGTAAGP